MNLELYVITDEAIAGGRSHAGIAQQAALGGADVIQLRDKTVSPLELLRAARELRPIRLQNYFPGNKEIHRIDILIRAYFKCSHIPYPPSNKILSMDSFHKALLEYFIAHRRQ